MCLDTSRFWKSKKVFWSWGSNNCTKKSVRKRVFWKAGIFVKWVFSNLHTGHVLASFGSLNEPVTLGTSLPLLLLGKLTKLLITRELRVHGLCTVLDATLVAVPGNIASLTKPAVAWEAFGERSFFVVVVVFVLFHHESGAVCEWAVDLERLGNGCFCQPSVENLEALWGKQGAA